jgi:hypothetical protein
MSAAAKDKHRIRIDLDLLGDLRREFTEARPDLRDQQSSHSTITTERSATLSILLSDSP